MRLPCKVAGCEKLNNSHGLCAMHGKRVERYGSVNPPDLHPRALPLPQRLMHYVEKTDSCWLWVGMTCKKGYGRIAVTGQGLKQAHRISYELHVGPIPAGLEIDHLCRVRNCVNPEHLEPVDHRTNVLRSPYTLSGMAVRRDTCLQGHEYDYVDSNGHRRCLTCRPFRQTVGERFAAGYGSADANGCIIWQGEMLRAHPMIYNGKRRVGARRFVYEKMIGEVPAGAVVIHTCKTTGCVAAAHIAAVHDKRWRPAKTKAVIA